MPMTAPVRACVQARLAHEGYKVEVQLTRRLSEAVIPSSRPFSAGEEGAKRAPPAPDSKGPPSLAGAFS